MTKIIWTCWFQGRENAPPLVKSCFSSWERNNPDWEFRCLDATTVGRYVEIERYVDLNRQTITAAGLSDILRIMLLHEFGGVWVDATLYCNQPLKDWLPGAMVEGFFAFSAPAPDRLLSSWFLSAEASHRLILAWGRQTIDYWSNRTESTDYYWFHHLFQDVVAADAASADAWSRIPRVSAYGPHALQFGGYMYRSKEVGFETIDWSTPVFKLTYRLPGGGAPPGSLLEYVLARDESCDPPSACAERAAPLATTDAAPKDFVSLKVSTENLGDHVQIIAGLRLLSRLGITPSRYVDRDDELDLGNGLPDGEVSAGILLNGWFKTNHTAWPPHPRYAPVIHGFHIRLFQCPELLSEASIDFFRRNEPVGCRDVYTADLLRSKGVDVFVSNCLTVTLPQRIQRPETQTEVFVVSRDERIRDVLPQVLDRYTFVSHYTGSTDFEANLAQAQEVLEQYRSRASLVVTTLLHCALPAIAMGIPVVVFYPLNDEAGHASDRERFSSLEPLMRIYRFDEIEQVDWNPKPIDVSAIKFGILDSFYEAAARWAPPATPPIGPIAPGEGPPTETRKTAHPLHAPAMHDA